MRNRESLPIGYLNKLKKKGLGRKKDYRSPICNYRQLKVQPWVIFMILLALRGDVMNPEVSLLATASVALGVLL